MFYSRLRGMKDVDDNIILYHDIVVEYRRHRHLLNEDIVIGIVISPIVRAVST